MIADDLKHAVTQFETQHIRDVLSRYPELPVAAKRLGIGLSTLYIKMAARGIENNAIPLKKSKGTPRV